MAAHALTITQQLLQLSLRADDGTLPHRLDEALSFAPEIFDDVVATLRVVTEGRAELRVHESRLRLVPGGTP